MITMMMTWRMLTINVHDVDDDADDATNDDDDDDDDDDAYVLVLRRINPTAQ